MITNYKLISGIWRIRVTGEYPFVFDDFLPPDTDAMAFQVFNMNSGSKEVIIASLLRYEWYIANPGLSRQNFSYISAMQIEPTIKSFNLHNQHVSSRETNNMWSMILHI